MQTAAAACMANRGGGAGAHRGCGKSSRHFSPAEHSNFTVAVPEPQSPPWPNFTWRPARGSHTAGNYESDIVLRAGFSRVHAELIEGLSRVDLEFTEGW